MPALAALDLGTNNCRLLVAATACRLLRGDRQLLADRAPRRRAGGDAAGSRNGRWRAPSRRSGCAPGSWPATACARPAASRPRPAAARSTAPSSWPGSAARPGSSSRFWRTSRRRSWRCSDVCRLIEPGAGPALLVDVGGGSTEILWLDRSEPADARLASMSLPVGVVALSEAFTSEPDESMFETMVRHVRAAIEARVGAALRLRSSRRRNWSARPARSPRSRRSIWSCAATIAGGSTGWRSTGRPSPVPRSGCAP